MVLEWLWIAMEVAVAALGVMIATQKKKSYGWFIALTFALYAFYDFLPYTDLYLEPFILDSLFVIASASILYAVWQIYKKK